MEICAFQKTKQKIQGTHMARRIHSDIQRGCKKHESLRRRRKMDTEPAKYQNT